MVHPIFSRQISATPITMHASKQTTGQPDNRTNDLGLKAALTLSSYQSGNCRNHSIISRVKSGNYRGVISKEVPMAKIKFSGPLSLRINSYLTISRIALTTYARRAIRKRIAPD